MGCPTLITLGNTLVFSICTHDPDTGILTDADAPPTYRVYANETGAAILTGTMSKLDDGNTVGFYTESIACTTGNGFGAGNTYTVYIEASVDSNTGGIAYGFNVPALTEWADALLDRADSIETNLTVREAQRLIAAALAGVLAGAGTTTITIANAVANDKTRLTATVDDLGNRTNIVADVS
jgi:hypothetical protein